MFDTDIGYDIDDAICLAYLLAKKDCELVGITTVCGDTVKRAQIARYLCNEAGKNVPICAGARHSMIVNRKEKTLPQLEGVPKNKILDGEQYKEKNFILFMCDIIKSNPHEVTLLAKGPFTNVGLLFSAAPEVVPLLKGITIMGGNFFNPFDGLGLFSSNALYDPHATYIMYNVKFENHYALGRDVTNNITMPIENKKYMSKHPLLKAVMPLVPFYFGKWNQPIRYHDVVAATTIFNKNIAQFVRGKVDVELEGNATQGMTLFKRNGYYDLFNNVARTVDKNAFLEEYLGAFGLTMNDCIL